MVAQKTRDTRIACTTKIGTASHSLNVYSSNKGMMGRWPQTEGGTKTFFVGALTTLFHFGIQTTSLFSLALTHTTKEIPYVG